MLLDLPDLKIVILFILIFRCLLELVDEFFKNKKLTMINIQYNPIFYYN